MASFRPALSRVILLYMILDIWYLISDIWYLILDIWYLISDTWYFICNAWYMNHHIWYLKSDTWKLIHAIWCLIYDHWDLIFDISLQSIYGILIYLMYLKFEKSLFSPGGALPVIFTYLWQPRLEQCLTQFLVWCTVQVTG